MILIQSLTPKMIKVKMLIIKMIKMIPLVRIRTKKRMPSMRLIKKMKMIPNTKILSVRTEVKREDEEDEEDEKDKEDEEGEENRKLVDHLVFSTIPRHMSIWDHRKPTLVESGITCAPGITTSPTEVKRGRWK